MELCKLCAWDRDALVELLINEQIGQTYLLPTFTRKENAVPLADRLIQMSGETTHYVRGIRVSGEIVGFLNDVEMTQGTVELGYVIHPDHWSKGYATAALRMAIADLGCEGMEYLICGAFAENRASQRVMEKAGMTRMERTDVIEYRGCSHICVYYEKKLRRNKNALQSNPNK